MEITEIIESEVRGEEGSATITLTAEELSTVCIALHFTQDEIEHVYCPGVEKMAEIFGNLDYSVGQEVYENRAKTAQVLEMYGCIEPEDDDEEYFEPGMC